MVTEHLQQGKYWTCFQEEDLKEQAASRICLRATGGEPRIQWKLEKSCNDLFETEATFLVPTSVSLLAPRFPLPLPVEPGLGKITFIDGEYKQV